MQLCFTQANTCTQSKLSKLYTDLTKLYAARLERLTYIWAQVLVLGHPPLLYVQRNGRLPGIHLCQSMLMYLSLRNHGQRPTPFAYPRTYQMLAATEYWKALRM